MLIKLQDIIRDYKLAIRGVIHIGAHYGQEYQDYLTYGVRDMMFFEPVKANFDKLTQHLPKDNTRVKTYNVALGNEIGEREMHIEKVKGQSCSLLEPGTHLELHPKIKFTDKEIVRVVKLDALTFDRTKYNMINIDVQGFELEVFKGATDTLRHIDYIYTEVNFEEVYKGCCKVNELDIFLGSFGFERVLTKDSGIRRYNTWGDALYIKKEYIVDFDKSIHASYCFNKQQYDIERSKWDLVKALYAKNFVLHGVRDYNTLPKKIHQIWLGSDPLPWHTKLADSWKRYNPSWEYRLWTDKDVDEVLSDRTLYDQMYNYGQKSDYLRYIILEKHGGLYIDTDFECLKSFDIFTYLDFLMGVGYPSKIELYNSLIACTPHNSIIKKVIDSIQIVGKTSSRNIFASTGVYLLTDVFFEMIKEVQKGILILPTDYLYPFPNKPGFEFEEGRDYIKPCSYAIHYYELLWINAHRKYVDERKQIRKF